MSPYRVAIDRTTHTIDRRARHFRNLIAAVVVIGVISSLSALAWRKPALVSGIFLVIPACGIFFFLDARLLQRWQSKLLNVWISKELELGVLRTALQSVPKLPQNTAGGMLDALPDCGDAVAERSISSTSRRAIATAAEAVCAYQADRAALKATASAIFSVSLIAAIAAHSWKPLAANAAHALVPAVQARCKRKRAAAAKAGRLTAASQPDFDDKVYCEVLNRLPGGAIGQP